MSRDQVKDKQRIVEQLGKMPIVEAACRQLSLPRATYYRWRKDDEAFAEACDDAIEQSTGKINDMAESQLVAAIKDKQMGAITFWLRHHHKSYKAKLEIDANVRQDNQILTPEQAELVTQALRLAGLASEETSDEK